MDFAKPTTRSFKFATNMAKGTRQFIGTILKDLSKTYHYLPHGLLIAILGVYGFDRFSLRLLLGYLNS